MVHEQIFYGPLDLGIFASYTNWAAFKNVTSLAVVFHQYVLRRCVGNRVTPYGSDETMYSAYRSLHQPESES